MQETHENAASGDGRARLSQMVPRCSEERILQKGSQAIGLLWEAYEYAVELGQEVWDFAVEIQCLQEAGLSRSDVRWLARKGLLKHAYETTTAEDAVRRFRQGVSLAFTRKSCFVLTSTGMQFACAVCSDPASLPTSSRKPLEWKGHGNSPPYASGGTPKWDADRGELRLNGYLVKRFKGPAANQEMILATFEEESWPPRIDDPLPPRPELEPKRRLHATINALNNRQKHALIRFLGDGTGEGVRWELVRTLSHPAVISEQDPSEEEKEKASNGE